jgi:hypothetical protein
MDAKLVNGGAGKRKVKYMKERGEKEEWIVAG